MNRYVLDTNIVLDDANVLSFFEVEGIVIIPLTVIEELDAFKKSMNSLGRNARHFSHKLDELRESGDGDFIKGVKVNDKITLRITTNGDISDKARAKMKAFDLKINDNKILLAAVSEKELHPHDRVILFSKDTNVRIKAGTVGIESKNLTAHRNLNINEVYKGFREIDVSTNLINKLYEEKEIGIVDELEDQEEFFANEYVIFSKTDDEQTKYIARFDKENQKFKIINYHEINNVYGIHARNDEQRIALDLLLNNDIKLVSLIGKAGTGKTLLAIAASLQELTKNSYEKLLISRPIFPMGRDLGFLPGTLDEKLRPWVQPIYDNLEFLLKSDRVDEFLEQQPIKVEALTYIRGRSIPNQILIVDEAQNLTNHEIKTIITRAGEGTKIILTGDPYQIDNPYLDVINNGLVHVIESMKDETIAATVTLSKGERSGLAQIAADKL